jgi:hypothetical protein
VIRRLLPRSGVPFQGRPRDVALFLVGLAYRAALSGVARLIIDIVR